MIPSADEVLHRRWLIGTWYRFGGMLAMPMGLVPAVSWIAEGMRDGDLLDLSYYGSRMVAACVLCLGGVSVFAFAPALATLTVPVHRGPPRCPGCGYELIRLAQPRCSECGLELSGSIVEASRQDEFSPRKSSRFLTRLVLPQLARAIVMLAVAWFAVVGLVGLLSAVLPDGGWMLSLILVPTAALGLGSAVIAVYFMEAAASHRERMAHEPAAATVPQASIGDEPATAPVT